MNIIKNYLKNLSIYELKIKSFIEELPEKYKKELLIQINKFKLKEITYFDDKSDEFLYEIGNNLKLINFNENEIIYNIDDKADEIYFIKEGLINIYINDNDNNPFKLFSIKPGYYFGELDIFFYSKMRKFKAVSQLKSELYILKFKVLDSIFFHKFLDCGDTMYNDAKLRHARIIKLLNAKNINTLNLNNSNNDSNNSKDTIGSLKILKDLKTEAKKKRESMFVNRLNILNIIKNKLSANATSKDLKKIISINDKLKESSKYISAESKEKLSKSTFELNKKIDKYQQIVDKYNVKILSQNTRKTRINKTNFICSFSVFQNYEKEIEYQSKEQIINAVKLSKEETFFN